MRLLKNGLNIRSAKALALRESTNRSIYGTFGGNLLEIGQFIRETRKGGIMIMLISPCLGILRLISSFVHQAPTKPYDETANRWLFDPQGIVSRNDLCF